MFLDKVFSLAEKDDTDLYRKSPSRMSSQPLFVNRHQRKWVRISYSIFAHDYLLVRDVTFRLLSPHLQLGGPHLLPFFSQLRLRKLGLSYNRYELKPMPLPEQAKGLSGAHLVWLSSLS